MVAIIPHGGRRGGSSRSEGDTPAQAVHACDRDSVGVRRSLSRAIHRDGTHHPTAHPSRQRHPSTDRPTRMMRTGAGTGEMRTGGLWHEPHQSVSGPPSPRRSRRRRRQERRHGAHDGLSRQRRCRSAHHASARTRVPASVHDRCARATAGSTYGGVLAEVGGRAGGPRVLLRVANNIVQCTGARQSARARGRQAGARTAHLGRGGVRARASSTIISASLPAAERALRRVRPRRRTGSKALSRECRRP